jgi:2-oxoglutarate/2-oxoacid ferredoxin oxidoreductase subunit beta
MPDEGSPEVPADVSPAELDYRQYLRLDMMPHILCPGCGHGIVLKAILRAVHRLGLAREEVVFVSGIGCSSRIVGYVDFCTLHTTHGRPLTFATGLKLARPDLRVVVITGDGDGLAIGGNHLIHAARRNIDVTCLLLNNATYGMTGGQGAPTTPTGARTSVTPSGAVEPAFDACALATAAGATFVARGLTATPLSLDDLIAQAIEHRGFSFLEVLSDCPEYFGRYNGLGRGPEMIQAQRAHVDWVGDTLAGKRFVAGLAEQIVPHAAPHGVTTGVLHRVSRPEFTELLGLTRRENGSDTATATGPSASYLASAAGPTAGSAIAPGSRRTDENIEVPAAGAATAHQPSGRPIAFARPCRVRLAGAGGQGIVLAGLILAEAAVHAGRNATHAQAYGPESRGGASKAEVILSEGEIDYPYADRADVLLALTQEAYDRYVAELEPDGVLITDTERVTVREEAGVTRHELPITATALATLGTTIGANLVALGALVAMCGLVPLADIEHAVSTRRPGGSLERALRALRAGVELVGSPRER